MRTRIHGRPLADHVLFVSNHESWLDILLLAGATGTAFVAKAEVAEWPMIGWLAGLNDSVFVAREERRGVRGQADALRTALAAGRPVALFPEGTTDGGTQVLPFRPSLLAALYPPLPGIRVQPVAIDYGAAAEEIAWVGVESAVANARKILSRAGIVPVAISFLEPIDPAQAGNRKALAHRAREQIVAALLTSAAPADRL
jgi:1-acyl-sn-glycerol-3-phosphate acyltransferase